MSQILLLNEMQHRVQREGESLIDFLYDKVHKCDILSLDLQSTKEQVATGLLSKDAAARLISSTATDVDRLFHDLMSFEKTLKRHDELHQRDSHRKIPETSNWKDKRKGDFR